MLCNIRDAWNLLKVIYLPHLQMSLTLASFSFETEGRHTNAKSLSSRDESLLPEIEPPTSSLRFGYLSTIIQ